MPKLSVIIPTYNRAAFLGAAMDSVLNQTFRDFELIIVDDGSTDDTAALVASRNDPHIRYIHQANAGETAARNTGIAHALGALIGFLDSDDVMLPHNLETLVGILDSRPDVDVAYGWFYFMNVDGSPLSWVHGQLTGVIPPQHDVAWPNEKVLMSGTCLEGKVFEQMLLEREGTIVIGGALIRRARIDKIGGFDPARKHQGHWDFYLRLARTGCVFACARQGVLMVRIHASGAHKQTEKMLRAWLEVLDGIFAKPLQPDVPAALHDQAYRNTYIFYTTIFAQDGVFDRAFECLNEAMRLGGPLDAMTLDLVAHALAQHVLGGKGAPLAMLNQLTTQVNDPRTRAVLRRTGTAIVSHHKVFEARTGSLRGRGQIARYAWHAIRSKPAFVRDRGLWRVVLGAMVKPGG